MHNLQRYYIIKIRSFQLHLLVFICSFLGYLCFLIYPMPLSLFCSTSSSSLTRTSSMLLFECFFFYFFLAALSLLPYSIVTLSIWRNTFVFISLLHVSLINIIAEWFIAIDASATTYSTAILMIVIRIGASMHFMLKRKKILRIKYIWKIFFHTGM